MNLSELPKPKGNLFVGNLTEIRKDMLGFFSNCASEYGDIVPLRLGLTPACLLTNPDYIEGVFQERNLFIKSRAFRIIQIFLGEGLFVSEGNTWLRQRRLALPMFHRQRIAAYGEAMVACTEQILNTWQDHEIRDVNAEMMRLTLNIVMKTIFNSDLTEKSAQDIAQALNVGMDWYEIKRKQGFLIPYWVPTPENLRCRQAVKLLNKTIYNIINQRRASGEDPGDLLSMLMQARDPEDGSQMTDQELRDQILNLIIPGHETTANTLSWTWMLLSQHQNVQTKLLEEVKEVLGDRSPSVADLPRLHYTKMVIKEAMRLYPPPTVITREPTKDCEIGGYRIPAGYYILIVPWVMHRHRDYFKAPEEFRPQRWANDFEKQLPKGVYFPFGSGPRICIAKDFAMMEAVLILATIVQKFKLELVEKQSIVCQPTATLRPKYGIKVLLKKRSLSQYVRESNRLVI